MQCIGSKNVSYNIFSEHLKAYDAVWILGEEFLTGIAGHIFNGKQDDNLYLKENYGMTEFVNNNLDVNRSILSRLRSCLIKAIEGNYLLPKVILIVVDRDMLHALKDANEVIYDKALEWLIQEYNKLIDIQKDRLPKRAIKEEYPQFVWFAPPFHIKAHDNFLRAKFTKSLNAITGSKNNHMMLHLKKIWDENDRSLKKHGRLTEVGVTRYWEALDSAFTFWCMHLAPQGGKVKQQQQSSKRHQGGFQSLFRGSNPFSKFKWQSEGYCQ